MLRGYVHKYVAIALIIAVSYTQLLHIFHTFLHEHRHPLHTESECRIHDDAHAGDNVRYLLPDFRLEPYTKACPLCDDLYHQHTVSFFVGDPAELHCYSPESVTLRYLPKIFVDDTSLLTLFNKGPPPPAGTFPSCRMNVSFQVF